MCCNEFSSVQFSFGGQNIKALMVKHPTPHETKLPNSDVRNQNKINCGSKQAKIVSLPSESFCMYSGMARA